MYLSFVSVIQGVKRFLFFFFVKSRIRDFSIVFGHFLFYILMFLSEQADFYISFLLASISIPAN